MYGGDMAQWKKFANSLRLRLAIHLSIRDATKAATEAAAAVAGGVFTGNGDNAELMYLATSPNRNPIYNDARGRDDYGMSKTFVDSLTSWNDPRLPVFAQPNPGKADRQGGEGALNWKHSKKIDELDAGMKPVSDAKERGKCGQVRDQ